ncbi:MFS transporter [Penicillium capsulatum]|nr:MFS transporter [Penicillium capsulatum]
MYHKSAARELSVALAGKGFSPQEIQGAAAGAQSALFEKLDGELRDKAIVAVTSAMKMTLVMVPVAGAVTLMAAACMKNERLFSHPIAAGA